MSAAAAPDIPALQTGVGSLRKGPKEHQTVFRGPTKVQGGGTRLTSFIFLQRHLFTSVCTYNYIKYFLVLLSLYMKKYVLKISHFPSCPGGALV